jgi:hypothetical protein
LQSGLLFGPVTLRNCANPLGLNTWRRSLAAFCIGVVTMIAATVGISAPANAGLYFPPSHLEGTIHVLLTAQPWSDDSGHFGGFHTTATLKNVEFKVSHGELQLEDHDGWLLPFTITQTLPAGLSGTCTAMWPFVNEHIDGNVAGFSESPAGKETATVSLGFSEVAKDPSGTGCGADLEETTHPFGEDPERFDISIQSKGTYAKPARANDFHGKELRFRSTSTQKLVSGTIVVRIDGTLY